MALSVTARDLDCEISFARSSGPGGQNVNKVNSKAVLRFDFANCTLLPEHVKQRFLLLFGNRMTKEGAIVIASDESRDQGTNVDLCYQKLQDMLDQAATRPKPRIATKQSRGSKAARVTAKKIRSAHKKTRQRVKYTD
jgi:ribosome-associated protein